MAVWEDQGLYFTLIFNAVVFTVLAIVVYIIHSRPSNARVLRPNRPGSTRSTFFMPQLAMKEMPETDVLLRNGVHPMFYILMLKFMFFLFTGMCLTAILIVAMCATDTYFNRNRYDNDPEGCGDKSQSECGDSSKCGFNTATNACAPIERSGLFDFSVLNIAPDDNNANVIQWRLIVFGIAVLACCVPIFLVLRRLVDVCKTTIRTSFILPIYDGLKYGNLMTVGARTVIIGGLANDINIWASKENFLQYIYADKEKRAELAKEKLPKKEKGAATTDAAATTTTPPANSPAKQHADEKEMSTRNTTPYTGAKNEPESERKHQPLYVTSVEDTTDLAKTPPKEKDDFNSPLNPTGKHIAIAACSSAKRTPQVRKFEPLGPTIDLNLHSWEIAKAAVIPDSVVLIRVAPDGLVDRIADEKEILLTLTDAVADEKAETDPAKKPVMKRPIPNCCSKVVAVDYEKNRLAENREELNKLLPTRDDQPMAGAAIVTFDRASHAFAFVRAYNHESFGSTAEIAGPREGVIWQNLSVSRAVAYVRTLLMVVIFTLLVFLWSIPVGFLGSLENLEVIPVMGPAIQAGLGVLPVIVLGTLGAYLPTIVLTVFNILLPRLLRFFGVFGGIKSVDQENRSVLVMCAVFSVMSGIVLQAALQGGLTQAVALITNPSGDAVIALIIAIVSPTGGYWFAYLITAGLTGSMIGMLVAGPLIISFILGKMTKRQEAYDKLFAPRATDYAFQSGRHLFFAAIGMLFHGTVAFLQPFAVMYTLLAYLTNRALMIDGGERDVIPIINYSFVLAYIHSILTMHTIAAAGNTLFCALRFSIGGAIIAGVSFLFSIFMHAYVHVRLGELVHTTPEQVAEYEAASDRLELLREQRDEVEPYVPEYSTFEIDRDAVPVIEALTFPEVDKTWPKSEHQLENDPAGACCCNGDDTMPGQLARYHPSLAGDRKGISELHHRIRTVEQESGKPFFYDDAHERAWLNRIRGDSVVPDDGNAVAVVLTDANKQRSLEEPLHNTTDNNDAVHVAAAANTSGESAQSKPGYTEPIDPASPVNPPPAAAAPVATEPIEEAKPEEATTPPPKEKSSVLLPPEDPEDANDGADGTSGKKTRRKFSLRKKETSGDAQ